MKMAAAPTQPRYGDPLGRLQTLAGQAQYIQPQAWILNFPDKLDSFVMKAVGLHRPISLSRVFSHLLFCLRDAHEKPLAYLHVMGEDPRHDGQPAEVAKSGARLKFFVLSPAENAHQRAKDNHRVIRGAILPTGDTRDRHLRADALTDYAATLNALELPYTVPESTVRGCVAARLAATDDLPVNKWHRASLLARRRYLGGAVMQVPPRLFAGVATLTGFPVSTRGYNSNSTGADIGEIFGINLREAIPVAKAPCIDRSPLRDLAVMRDLATLVDRLNANLHHAAGMATAAPNGDDATKIVLERPPLVLPELRILDAA